ncbi:MULTISPECIES: glutamate racemase [unclassified Oceanobacter]|uniref:glutamate racemase n=1 Tax=unclassified Oceanobacter TaxID=2620260 RepID=UPI0026E278DC|nr:MULTISPECIES: glutamate racemase [unclassified Oceanobacter]MDO6683519.1 glutamate racemase [Oceanobacter sp. 5_MG-2023]MDP2547373.1 glutamate racemase [Oceanobacter sp. 4_MG-2023]
MILVFDSGVGGLGVVREIHQLRPDLTVHYLMDTAAFPYGIQNDQILTRRIIALCQQAVAALPVKLLVIACNTASTLALDSLRAVLDIPVVGVVPAIKTAAEQSANGVIGLLATPATISRSYTDKLINDFAAHCDVRRLGSRQLVEWAESLVRAPDQYHQGLSERIQQHLSGWIEQTPRPSHIVLGCTHFPLLRPYLSKLWPTIIWVDSGAAIARRVNHLLGAAPADTRLGQLYLYQTNGIADARYLSQFWSAAALPESINPDWVKLNLPETTGNTVNISCTSNPLV